MNEQEQQKKLCKSIVETLQHQRKNKVKNGFYWENQIAFAYNSEKLEGNPLTSEQTRKIFETKTLNTNNKTVQLDYVQETSNHFRMFDLMLDTLNDDLTEELICSFHQALKKGTSDDLDDPNTKVGSYKLIENAVGNITTTPPAFVKQEIQKLLEQYQKRTITTYREITGFHALFERIHPFQDGNGRVGRIIMFRECLKNDLIPFIVLDEHKENYYKALQVFQNNNLDVKYFISFAKQMSEIYLKDYLNLMSEQAMLLLPNYQKYRNEPKIKSEEFFD